MNVPQPRSRIAIAIGVFVLTVLATVPAPALPVAWNVDVHQNKFLDYANDFHLWGVLESGDPDGSNPPTYTTQVNFQTTGQNGIPPFAPVPGGSVFPNFSYQIGNPVNRPLPPAYPGPNPPQPPFYYFDGNWSGVNVPYCNWMHFGLQFDETCHNIGYWLQGVWTRNGVDPIQQPIYGFEVRDGILSPERQRIRIQNSSAVETVVDQMQMLILPAGQSFALADLNTEYFRQHTEYQWKTVPTALLPPGGMMNGIDSFFDVFFDEVPGLAPLGPGETLIARQYSSYEGGSTDYFWQYELHGAHVPEPGALTLLLAGGMAASLMRRR